MWNRYKKEKTWLISVSLLSDLCEKEEPKMCGLLINEKYPLSDQNLSIFNEKMFVELLQLISLIAGFFSEIIIKNE